MQRRSQILSCSHDCNTTARSVDCPVMRGRGDTTAPLPLTRSYRVTQEAMPRLRAAYGSGGFFVQDATSQPMTCCTPETAWAFVQTMTDDALTTGCRVCKRLIPKAVDHAIRITQQYEAQR